jgi:hypothetical protein
MIDLVNDWNQGITGTYEIAMQGMAWAVRWDGPIGGHERLGDHLPAENALAFLFIRALPPEKIMLKTLNVQEAEKITDRILCHGPVPYRSFCRCAPQHLPDQAGKAITV